MSTPEFPALVPAEARAPWRGPRPGDAHQVFVMRDPAAIEESVLSVPVRWVADESPQVRLDTTNAIQAQALTVDTGWQPINLPALPGDATGHLLLTFIGWRPYPGTAYSGQLSQQLQIQLPAALTTFASPWRVPTHPGYTAQALQALIDALTEQRPLVLQRGYLPAPTSTAPPAQRSTVGAKPSSPAPLCLAFASCQYPAGVLDELPAQASLKRLAARCTRPPADAAGPQCVLLIGDQIYADASYGLLDPTRLDDRINTAYANWLGVAPLREIMLRVPVHCMLDDHELQDNWEPTAPGATADPLFTHGIRAFWAHQRLTSPGTGPLPPLWGPVPLGSAHEAFVLDTRSERDPRPWPAADLQTAHILGQTQRDALESWLRSAKAGHPRWIVSPVWLLPRPAGQPDRNGGAQAMNPALCDAWPGYPDSLDWMLGLIARERIENIVMLCGDAHLAGHTVLTLTRQAETTAPAIRVDLLHCPALYAPFPFANAQPHEFLLEDVLSGGSGPDAWRCEVRSSLWNEGDGFVLVRFNNSLQGPRITATFDTPSLRPMQISIP